MAGFQGNASGLRAVGRAVRSTAPSMYTSVRATLRKTGNDMVQGSRSRSAWSTRIPQTIKVRPSGVLAIIISAGGETAPHAPVYEGKGTAGQFRHPLFGDRTLWYSEDRRPFLHPAVLARIGIMRDAITAACVNTVREKLGEAAREDLKAMKAT